MECSCMLLHLLLMLLPSPSAVPYWLGNCHWVISTHPPSHLINWRTQVAKCTECATDRLHDAHMRGVGKSLLSYHLHLANGFVHRQKCLLCMLLMQSIWAKKERHKHLQLVDSSIPALASVHQNRSLAPLQSIQVLLEAHALKPNAHPTKLFKFRYPLLSVECQFQCTATAIFPLLAILALFPDWLELGTPNNRRYQISNAPCFADRGCIMKLPNCKGSIINTGF